MTMLSSNQVTLSFINVQKTLLTVSMMTVLMMSGCHSPASDKTNNAADKNKGSSPSGSIQADQDAMVVKHGEELVVPNNSPLKTRLKVDQVTNGFAQHVNSFPGAVEANAANVANIESPVTGRITQMLVKMGDHVNQGQVLAMVSSGDLAQALSDVAKAKDSLHLAQQALNRAQGVNSIGANATKDLEAAQSSVEQAKAEFVRANQRLQTLGGAQADKIKLSNGAALLPIVATSSGYITALNVGVGSYINDNTSTMLTLSNLDQVMVTANIPENSLNTVHVGQAANILFPAYPGQVFHGTISSVSNVLDNDTRRSKARIVLANAGMKFKPNMYATVQIETQENGQISVPPSALLMNNDEVTVFVEVKPNTYVRKTVTLGSEDENNVQILSGLAPTDRVVISGGVLLND